MIRTKWICPNCMELSPTRHWSVLRHIQRKHAGVGEPISINTYQTRAQMSTGSGSRWINSYSTPTSNPTHNFSDLLDTGIGRQSQLSSQKKGITIEDILVKFYQNVDLEKLEQNQLGSGHHLAGIPSTGIPIESLTGLASPEGLSSFIYLKHLFENNRNVGFRGYVCTNCLSSWVDPVCNNKEGGMKSLIHENPSIHKCHAEKALEVSKYSSDELESEKSQALERLNYFFSPLVIGIAWLAMTTTMTIYLNVEEIDLVPQRQSSYYTSFAFASSSKRRNGVTNLGDDKRAQEINGREQHEEQRLVPRAIEENCIDLRHVNSIENSHWTYRAINGHGKRSIAINAGELNDFVRTTKATFGTFKVQMKDDVASSYFFMYFSCS